MSTTTISTKEIRNDLEGFLRMIKRGETLQVMFRSKPLVTVTAATEVDTYLNTDAGTPQAGQRSVAYASTLTSDQANFDSDKSFKELYNETQQL